MENTRGKADERGKIPSFKIVDLVDMEEERKEAVGKGHVFIADMGGQYVSACHYN